MFEEEKEEETAEPGVLAEGVVEVGETEVPLPLSPSECPPVELVLSPSDIPLPEGPEVNKEVKKEKKVKTEKKPKTKKEDHQWWNKAVPVEQPSRRWLVIDEILDRPMEVDSSDHRVKAYLEGQAARKEAQKKK